MKRSALGEGKGGGRGVGYVGWWEGNYEMVSEPVGEGEERGGGGWGGEQARVSVSGRESGLMRVPREATAGHNRQLCTCRVT